MLSYTHQLFGHNKPVLTGHFFQRYAERIYNVSEKSSEIWARNASNRIRIVKDFYSRLKKAKIILLNDSEKREYYEKKYGNDITFLQHNNYIFVIRQYSKVVTLYKEM